MFDAKPLPEEVPEEQHVNADHDDDHRDDVQRGNTLPAHACFLLRATYLCKRRL